MKNWKCISEGCEDGQIYRHKGLCRSCTEYGDGGEVLTPVNRVRVYADGTPIPEAEPRQRVSMTRHDYINARRPKLTNRQKDYIRELHAHAHAHHDDPDHVHGPDCGHDIPADTEIMQIGESLVASETEFDTLIGGEEE
jgi:hypothetical protein